MPSTRFVTDLGHRLERDPARPVTSDAAHLTRAEVRHRLTRAGDATPVPAPGFVSTLDRRLVRSDATTGTRLLAFPPRRRGVLRAVTAAAASVAAVLLATALLGGFGGGGHGLQLGVVVNTTVVLPNGHAVVGRAGLPLPNGSGRAPVRTALATAGPVDLGPGLQAVVNVVLPPAGQPRRCPPSTRPAVLPVTVPSRPWVTVPTTRPTNRRCPEPHQARRTRTGRWSEPQSSRTAGSDATTSSGRTNTWSSWL